MSDFRVQAFEVVVPAADSSTDIEIPRAVITSKTRVIMASPGLQMQVITSGGFVPVATRDLLVGVELIDEHTVRVHSSPNAQRDGVASFSLLEYIGKDGGANEFSVVRTSVFNPVGSNGIDLEAIDFAVTNPGSTTTHIVGCIWDNVNTSDTAVEGLTSTLYYPAMRFVTDFDTLEYQQIWIGNNERAVQLWIEHVDWTGSNWTITHPPFDEGTTDRADTITFTTAGGAGKTVTLATSNDWTNTWIESTRGCDLFTGPVDFEIRSHIYPDMPSGTDVIAFTPAAGDVSDVATNGASFYAISNPDIKVAHQGRNLVDGDATFQATDLDGPRTFTIPISNDSVTINAEEDRVICLLNGSPANQTYFAGASAQFHGDHGVHEILVRRGYHGVEGWLEYIQTVQFGLEAGASGTIEDSVIRQPSISTTIRNQ